MIKKPVCFCFFDDGKELFSKLLNGEYGDPFLALEDSPMNLELNSHIMSVSHTDSFAGHDSAQIVIDNEESKFTSRLFDSGIFRAASFEADEGKEGRKGQFLSEGLSVLIYFGYYSDGFNNIRLKLNGQIQNISFSYNSGGTPNISMLVTDRFTFMSNPRLRNQDVSTMEKGGEKELIPLTNSYVSEYLEEDAKVDLGITSKKTPKSEAKGTRSSQSADLSNLYKRDSQRAVEYKGRKKSTSSKVYRNTQQIDPKCGLRDSQIVALVINEYNKKVSLTAGLGEEYTIKRCFIAMTGEGGNTYTTQTCYGGRARKNVATRKISVGYSDYIQYLAGKHNFDCYVKDRCLFFIPPIIKSVPDFVYTYSNPKNVEDIKSGYIDGSLISFTPKLNVIKLGVDFYAMEYDEDSGIMKYIKTNLGKSLRDKDGSINTITSFEWHQVSSDKAIKTNIVKTPGGKNHVSISDQTGGALISGDYFGNAKEELIKSLMQAEADVLDAEMEMEGNPNVSAGMTIQTIGMSGDAKAGQRFDGNYRVAQVVHSWTSAGYKMRLSARTRSIQGITFISKEASIQKLKSDAKKDWVGIWKKNFLLEPSLIWENVAENKSLLSDSVRSSITDSEQLLVLIENRGLNEGSFLGKHTFDADVKKFRIVADICPMVSYEEALAIMYGSNTKKTKDFFLDKNTKEAKEGTDG